MRNVYELPKRTDPVEAAGDWIAKLDRGMDEQEEATLRDWLAADPRNPPALMESAKVWDKLDSLARLADLFPLPVRRQSRPARTGWALAATVLIAVAAGYWGTAQRQAADSDPGPQQVFQTAVGEHSTVTLPDGSQVTLNTNSRIRARFTQRQRILLLERGEVYVQVARDPLRPLSVWVGDRFVEAVGTAFNIAIKEDRRVELIVAEGKVLVGVAGRQAAEVTQAEPPLISGASSIPVSAGERLLLGEDNSAIESLAPEELEVQLSWRGGKLVFRGESLAEALTEIERYTPVEFVILDENLKKVRIVGMFKAGDVDGLLTTLTQNFDIAHQRISDERVILTHKPNAPGKGG